jgi:hypothetical protein
VKTINRLISIATAAGITERDIEDMLLSAIEAKYQADKRLKRYATAEANQAKVAPALNSTSVKNKRRKSKATRQRISEAMKLTWDEARRKQHGEAMRMYWTKRKGVHVNGALSS